LLDKFEAIRYKVIKQLSTVEHFKTASKLLKKYKFPHQDFPELYAILVKNSSNYFISRTFRNPSHEDFLPLAKIEDLFAEKHLMLIQLTTALLKKKRYNQAKGVWNRNSLIKFAP